MNKENMMRTHTENMMRTYFLKNKKYFLEIKKTKNMSIISFP